MNAESSDERLLRQILEGEVDEHHAEVAQRLARSPALAARLAEMRAAAKALDALGEEARDVLGEVSEERDTSDLPGADRLEIVRARLSAETSRGRFGARWLAAAAVLLSLAVVLAARWGDEAAPPIRLGGEVPLLAPVGATAAFDAFTWELDLPEESGCHFVVRVFAADGTGLLLQSPPLRTTQWRPSPTEQASLPDAIVWEVHVVDPLERSRASGSARAERRSR